MEIQNYKRQKVNLVQVRPLTAKIKSYKLKLNSELSPVNCIIGNKKNIPHGDIHKKKLM